MQYKLKNEFAALSETGGVFYALPEYGVEIATGSSAPDKDTGFVLTGGKPVYFTSESTIYARATGGHAVLNVVSGTLG